MNASGRFLASALLAVINFATLLASARGETHVSGVPQLSSRPGAPYTIYLDFAGFNYPGTWAGKTPGNVPAFNYAIGSFIAVEQLRIQQVWARVADAYSMFNINITTVDPAVAAGQADTDAHRLAYYDATARLQHTIMMPNNTWWGNKGGFTNPVGQMQFSGVSPGWHTNWDFQASLSFSLLGCSEPAVHENGHALNLNHQSDYVGSTFVNDYSLGDNNSSPGTYAPIMGASYNTQRGAWRVGDNSATASTQNDIGAILSSNPGLGIIDDGIGHFQGSPTSFPLVGSNVNFNVAKGVISPNTFPPTPIGSSNYTSDFYAFQSNGIRPISLTVHDGTEYVTPGIADPNPMLRSQMAILNASGQYVAAATEAPDTLSETFNGVLPVGTYYAQISSYGGHFQQLYSGTGSTYFNQTSYYDTGSYFLTGSGFAYVWRGPFSGSWATQGNWSNSTVPDAGSIDVIVNAATTTPLTITLDDGQTIGTLVLGNSYNNNTGYIISPGAGGSLFFDNGSNTSTLTVTDGNHTISAPMSLTNILSVGVAANAILTLSGNIGPPGPGGVSFSGPGKLVLSGNNIFLGGVTINSGLLQVQSNSALGTGTLSLSGGTLQAGTSVVTNVPVQLTAFGAIDSNGNSITLNGTIFGSGSFQKIGPGTLLLSASNTYTGGTTIAGGVLQVGNNAALGASTAGLAVYGGTFDVHGYSINVGPLQGAGTIDNLNGNGLLTVGNGNASSTFSGTMQNTSGQLSLVKVGLGTISVTGNIVLSGSVAVTSGYLEQLAGRVNTPTLTVTTATYALDGPSNLSAANEFVGYGGNGLFTQSGGTNSILTELDIGLDSGPCQYNLSGGSLAAPYEYVGKFSGGYGTCAQSDGTNSVPELYLGNSSGAFGSYSLTGSGLLTTAKLSVGYSGNGLFTQSGGANSANSLYLGDLSGAFGRYSLAGNGLLTTANLWVGFSGSGSITQSSGTASVGVAEMGFDIGSSGAYNLNGGSLASTAEVVGNSGTVSFTQSGGTNSTPNLYLGQDSGGFGSYALGGSGLLTTANLYVGLSGSGSFTQSGGVASAGAVYIGYYPSSSGSYSLNGGSLAAGYEYIGHGGSGSFTQNGGTNSISTELDVCYGGSSGAQGLYNLNGGALAAPTEYVGNLRSGTFMQSGGTNSATALYLGYNAGATGSYTLGGSGLLTVSTLTVGNSGNGSFTQNGGSASAGTMYVAYYSGVNGYYASSGSYNLNGGSLAASVELVGYAGNGSFTQSGGVNSLSIELEVGDTNGAAGRYNLTAGSLAAPTELIGNFTSGGTLAHSGGTNSASNLYLGYNGGAAGAYSLGGSGLLTAANLYAGYYGSGSFTQSGGTASAGTAYVGYYSSGSYILNAGSLAASAELVGYAGSGSFTQSGGTNAMSGFLSLGKVSSTDPANPNGGSGNYLLNSGLLTAPSEYVGDAGNGSFTQSGGMNSATTGLFVALAASGSGTYNLSGGSLFAGLEYIGNSGAGGFIQSGGANVSSSGSVILGFNVSASGSYNLNGSGLLSTANETIGYLGSGSFTQSGGTNAMSASLTLGQVSASNGSYALNGGLLTAPSVYVGISGNGAFTQSGGTHSVGSSLFLGYSLGSSGSYNMTDGGPLLNAPGGLLTAPAAYVGLSGSGSFTQSGGVNTLSNELDVGYSNSAAGYYNLTAGSLAAPTEYIGISGSGTLAHGGGTNVASNLYLGYNGGGVGSYSLFGSGLLSTTGEFIGYSGSGSFTQGGGTNSASNLYLGYNGGGAGSYFLVGGLLSATGEYIGYGGGSFTQSGGTFTQTGGTNSVSHLVLADYPGSSGTYFLLSGYLRLSGLDGGSGVGSGIATFNFNNGVFQAAATFATSLPMRLNRICYFDPGGNTLTLSGALSGVGALNEVGTGTLILSGTNTYSGVIDVMHGTLLITTPYALHDGANLTVGNSNLFFSPVVPSAAAAEVTAVPEPGTYSLLAAAMGTTLLTLRSAVRMRYSRQ
jgi:autotransporter-associated beta strand protein